MCSRTSGGIFAAIALPERVAGSAYFLHRAPADSGLVVALLRYRFHRRLDSSEEPHLTIALLAAADQLPFALEFFPREIEVEISLVIVALYQLISADVPDHHRAAAVLAFRDDTFEIEIVQRMIFRRHGETFFAPCVRRSLRHGP